MQQSAERQSETQQNARIETAVEIESEITKFEEVGGGYIKSKVTGIEKVGNGKFKLQYDTPDGEYTTNTTYKYPLWLVTR